MSQKQKVKTKSHQEPETQEDALTRVLGPDVEVQQKGRTKLPPLPVAVVPEFLRHKRASKRDEIIKGLKGDQKLVYEKYLENKKEREEEQARRRKDREEKITASWTSIQDRTLLQGNEKVTALANDVAFIDKLLKQNPQDRKDYISRRNIISLGKDEYKIKRFSARAATAMIVILQKIMNVHTNEIARILKERQTKLGGVEKHKHKRVVTLKVVKQMCKNLGVL